MAADDQPLVKLRSSMMTDVGMVRDHNEDSAFVDDDLRFFVVADGMGGHAAGEVASAMAVESVRKALTDSKDEIATFVSQPTEEGRQKIVAVLEQAVREAHRSVYERGVNEPDKQGMGTTLDVVLVAGAEAFVAHVGDSRTYLLRDGSAAQITTDHTVAEVLVIEGKLSTEEAAVSPLRTILVNAIGVAPEVGVEMAHLRLRKGDRMLLCSDGLHDYFPSEEELADKLLTAEPEAALSEMVDIAKNRGGHDNITGVVLEILEAPAPPEDSPEVTTAPLPTSVPQPVPNDDTQPVERDGSDESTDGVDTANLGSGQPKGKDRADESDAKPTLKINVGSKSVQSDPAEPDADTDPNNGDGEADPASDGAKS